MFALAETSCKTTNVKSEKETWILTLIFEMCCEEVKFIEMIFFYKV
jgi:hypothetical protein